MSDATKPVLDRAQSTIDGLVKEGVLKATRHRRNGRIVYKHVDYYRPEEDAPEEEEQRQ